MYVHIWNNFLCHGSFLYIATWCIRVFVWCKMCICSINNVNHTASSELQNQCSCYVTIARCNYTISFFEVSDSLGFGNLYTGSMPGSDATYKMHTPVAWDVLCLLECCPLLRDIVVRRAKSHSHLAYLMNEAMCTVHIRMYVPWIVLIRVYLPSSDEHIPTVSPCRNLSDISMWKCTHVYSMVYMAFQSPLMCTCMHGQYGLAYVYM